MSTLPIHLTEEEAAELARVCEWPVLKRRLKDLHEKLTSTTPDWERVSLDLKVDRTFSRSLNYREVEDLYYRLPQQDEPPEDLDHDDVLTLIVYATHELDKVALRNLLRTL